MKFGIEGLDDNEEVNRVVHKELDVAFEQIRVLGPESRERCVMACFDRLDPFFRKMGVDVRSSRKGPKFMTAALRIELQKRIDADMSKASGPGPAYLSRYDRDEEMTVLTPGSVIAGAMMPDVRPSVPLPPEVTSAGDVIGSASKAEVEKKIAGVQQRMLDIIEQLDSKAAQQRVLIEVLLKEFNVGFSYQELCAWGRDLARQWQAPQRPDTPNNFEAIAMNVMHFTCAIGEKLPHDLEIMGHKLNVEEYEVIEKVWEAVAQDVPEFKRAMARCNEFYRLPIVDDHELALGDFAGAWRESSYAKLEIGHKLAAALCVTDIKDEEVMAPWKACSIIVPDGLLEINAEVFSPETGATRFDSIKISRIWCVGNEPRFVVLSDATFRAIGNPYTKNWDEMGIDKKYVDVFRNFGIAVWNLAKGAFLALANPEEFKKGKTSSASSSKPKREHSAPDLSQVRYMLSAPIQVDLRDALKEHLSGKRKAGSGSPKVQFLVRGHWRQQAHGKGRLERKTIWIQPFLKGDPTMRMLLRNYAIKESDSTKSSES